MDDVTGDPKLAAFMRDMKVRAPIERIERDDHLLTMANMDKIRIGHERFVVLACGHRKLTGALYHAACHDCHKMILKGEDYDAFRNHRG